MTFELVAFWYTLAALTLCGVVILAGMITERLSHRTWLTVLTICITSWAVTWAVEAHAYTDGWTAGIAASLALHALNHYLSLKEARGPVRTPQPAGDRHSLSGSTAAHWQSPQRAAYVDRTVPGYRLHLQEHR